MNALLQYTSHLNTCSYVTQCKSQTANCNAYLKVDNEHNYRQMFPADFNISHSRSIFCHKVMHP